MDMEINVSGGQLSQEEVQAYIAHGKRSYPGRSIRRMDVKLDGEYVDLA